jgi:hypothetical protein
VFVEMGGNMNSRVIKPLGFAVLLLALQVCVAQPRTAIGNPFDAEVIDTRPRIFVRKEPFEGLTVEKLRTQIDSPQNAWVRRKWRARPMGRGLLWLINGETEDLHAAVAGLEEMDATEGSWSGRGLALMRMATLFDWLYDDLDKQTRRETISKIESAADDAVTHVRRGQAPFFYTRTPGALAGLCVAGIALHGLSEKAEEYLQTFREFGVDEYFQAYQWVDGAATGATYTLHYTYVDMPSICAAWWSATGKNPAEWIREEQGNWLDGIVRFYLWYMRPGFAFTDINDQFRRNWDSHDEYCQGLDIASYVTRNGYGRAWSQRWFGRFGASLYHSVFAHNLIFRDPSIAAEPLTDLPLAELFGRESCGYGFFRSSWPQENEPDNATHVFFRCGDPMDVHGGVAAGEFQIFKYTPLAARSGRYSSYDSPPDQYHRNCISTNVVLFTDPAVVDDRGDQNTRRGLKTDHKIWADWLQIRQRNELDVARIIDWQVRPGEARCRADLTNANSKTKCARWIREFVWLAQEHLVVLDLVETAKPTIRRQWQVHCPSQPEIGDHLFAMTSQAPDLSWSNPALKPPQRTGRLFCQTLLPRDYRVIVHGEGQAEAFDSSGRSLGPDTGNAYHQRYGRNVVQIDPGTQHRETIFLHVLTATEADEKEPPQVRFRIMPPGELEVSVKGKSTCLVVPTWLDENR